MKETNKLLKMLKKGGWQVVSHAKHIKVKAPNGRLVVLSSNIRNASTIFQRALSQAGMK